MLSVRKFHNFVYRCYFNSCQRIIVFHNGFKKLRSSMILERVVGSMLGTRWVVSGRRKRRALRVRGRSPPFRNLQFIGYGVMNDLG